MTEHMAYVLLEHCGCVVAVTVQDDEMHFAQTVANWKRGKLRVEHMTVEAARKELGNTFEHEQRHGRRHWRKMVTHPVSESA